MKHFLLLFCFCSALSLAQTNQGTTSTSDTTDEGPFLRHLKARNSTDWKSAKEVAAKVAEGTGKVAARIAVIPTIPIYFVGMVIHCSFHDCGVS